MRGHLFVIVRTMISGAREWMTPGSWRRDGWTYRLKSSNDSSESNSITERTERLELSWRELRSSAAEHEGRFPNDADLTGKAAELAFLPDHSGIRYLLMKGRNIRDAQPRLLAYEPAVYSSEPLALFTDDSVRALPIAEITALREEEGTP